MVRNCNQKHEKNKIRYNTLRYNINHYYYSNHKCVDDGDGSSVRDGLVDARKADLN